MFEYCRLIVGHTQVLNRLVQQLTDFSYQRVDQVADPGQFAIHGGVLDFFPGSFELPLRLEFEGQRIASIRSFNPRTFETIERHTMVVVLPRAIRTRVSLEIPFESVLELKPGDFVVHLEHGIGRYVARAPIDEAPHQGKPRPQEALILEYADGDRLYVPLDQMHLLQKYVAFGARSPALHKLGGMAWARAKAQAYVGAWNYAKTLLELQAKRLALPGVAFSPDGAWQQKFEAAFPYRETVDQLQTTREVKQDMEQPRPMDRVLLGDVGYGKTEVAMRAAFKAVTAHKQVAILVPTTVLAYQHYRTFCARMQDFPIVIAMLSRFQSEAEERKVLKDLAEGRCDLVIGTHRLLSGDVRFKDLGLLIIDEEQRFGVKHKEHLKHWRTQLDVLVLSATPIPRTLYMALLGSRDMSLIATPPENRHPVETHLVEEDERCLREWIVKELNRKGQVFVIHNRVRSIHSVAQKIQRLVPEARVGLAHGQMAEGELETVMLAFMTGALDVLVTTTIIESGIDIPNANTLIVYRADAFGLADLYQLRGRVGRFDRKAYAYLVVPKEAILTQEARRRLEIMTTYTQLGAGFSIAMEDLKLRGAGNLLGVEQSGYVSAVGFDLYCRLLREAVQKLRENPHFSSKGVFTPSSQPVTAVKPRRNAKVSASADFHPAEVKSAIGPRPSIQEGSRNCRLTIVDFRLNRGLSIDNPKSTIGNSKVVL